MHGKRMPVLRRGVRPPAGVDVRAVTHSLEDLAAERSRQVTIAVPVGEGVTTQEHAAGTELRENEHGELCDQIAG